MLVNIHLQAVHVPSRQAQTPRRYRSSIIFDRVHRHQTRVRASLITS